VKPGERHRVCLIPLDDSASMQTIARWLERSRFVSTDLTTADVVWYHAGTATPLPPVEPPPRDCAILCTGGATRLLSDWGWEPTPPSHGDEQAALSSGLAAFRNHPLFDGLPGGVLWRVPAAGHHFTTTSYRDGAWPQVARVIAVARVGTEVFADHATVWEMVAPNRGITLAMGARLPLFDDVVEPALDLLLRNALAYCARGRIAETIAWPRPGAVTVHHDTGLRPRRLPALTEELSDPVALPFRAHHASAAAFAMVGRRALASGLRRLGVCELWVQPTRIMNDLAVQGFTPRLAATSPGLSERSNKRLRERCFLPHELGGALWHWQALESTELSIGWTIDMQVSGPYPPGLLGSLHWNAADRWLILHAADENDAALYCFDRAVNWIVTVPDDNVAVLHVRAVARLEAGQSLMFAAAGSSPGSPGLDELARTLESPAALLRSGTARAVRIGQQRVQIRTPVDEVNQSWHWALQWLDRACIDAPNVGRALIGGAVPDAEPGAWIGPSFRTQSSVNAALAALALGDFDAARLTLELLLGKQHPDGAVPAQCATSGMVDYSARDVALLLPLLFARYFAWTANLTFARRHWPRVRLADREPCTSSAAIVLRELALTAESIGEQRDAQRIRACAERCAARPFQENAEPSPDAFTFTETADRWPATWLSAHLDPGAARIINQFVYGLLGMEPDAVRQRVVVRPALPVEWDSLNVENLRLADAQFALHFERHAGTHTFALVPQSGTVPLRVIFEPMIAAQRITRVEVDGQSAALNLHRRADRWVCPLQIVLDHERRISIETADSEAVLGQKKPPTPEE
jgi:hypothetical protein